MKNKNHRLDNHPKNRISCILSIVLVLEKKGKGTQATFLQNLDTRGKSSGLVREIAASSNRSSNNRSNQSNSHYNHSNRSSCTKNTLQTSQLHRQKGKVKDGKEKLEKFQWIPFIDSLIPCIFCVARHLLRSRWIHLSVSLLSLGRDQTTAEEKEGVVPCY